MLLIRKFTPQKFLRTSLACGRALAVARGWPTLPC